MKRRLSVGLSLTLSCLFLIGSSCSAYSALPAAAFEEADDVKTGSSNEPTRSVRTLDDGRTEVVIGTTNNTGSLDPMLSDQANNRKDLVFLVYETLVFANEDGTLDPLLAESYEIQDLNVCNVKLRENIYDSEGNHITASDVKFCYDTVKDSGNPNLNTLESIEAVDDYNLVFTLNSDDPLVGAFSSVLTSVYIVSQSAYEASEDKMAANPIGTGPYVLTDLQQGTSVTFEKRDDYWNKDNPTLSAMTNFDVIQFQLIGDKSQVAIALETGNIDISDCVTSADASNFEDGGDYADEFDIQAVPKNLALILAFNCSEDSPFNNINLRKAVAYSFDTASIIEGAEGGYGVEINAPVGRYSSYYNEDWDSEDYFEYNPDTAAEYLKAFEDETGTKASDLNVRILSNANNSAPCELLGAYLNAMGIPFELDMLDQSVVVNTRTDSTAWDIYVNEVGFSGDDQKRMFEWLSQDTNDYGNYQFIEDDTLEELANKACRYSTVSQDAEDELIDYINENCYMVGLYQRSKNDVYASWITKVVHNSSLNILINACEYAQ